MLAPEVIESAEKRVGETISGKWHLDRVIGVGGMAAVYEATHRNRNRVAIKLLHRALSLDEGTRHRFLREGYVANTIRHSGAVQILDDELTDEGVAFLVMELLRGESVDERMVRKGGALEIQEALNIADQLLDVLGAAHDQNVIHRDIKPDNLFLTEEGKLKVLDFGIARLHQGDTRATKVGSFMGTPAFCAPEQARGRWDEVDLRTDLFSVGATLFTCLSGTHVHEAETSSEQLALAISASARSLAEVLPGAPQDLVDLVDKALCYDKEDRFQSARAMRAAVQRVHAGLTEHRSAPRFLSTPPPGGVTLTHSEHPLHDSEAPDSVLPSGFPGPPITMRLLIGLLVAGLLAALLLVFAREQTGSEHRAAAAETEKPGSKPEPVAKQEGQGSHEVAQADEEAKGREATPEKPDALTVTQPTVNPVTAPRPIPPVKPTPAPQPTVSQKSAIRPPPAGSSMPPLEASPPPAPKPQPVETESSADGDVFRERF